MKPKNSSSLVAWDAVPLESMDPDQGWGVLSSCSDDYWTRGGKPYDHTEWVKSIKTESATNPQ